MRGTATPLWGRTVRLAGVHVLLGAPRVNTRSPRQARFRYAEAAGSFLWMHRLDGRSAARLPTLRVQTVGGKRPERKRCLEATPPRRLGDDLQNVEDQLHDHRALAQPTRPAVDDGDQGAVQVAQVLRQKRLAVTSCLVAHLQPRGRRE